MLFRKDIRKCCGYCTHSARQEDGTLICGKKAVDEDKSCFRFRYDPCKRIPLKAKALDFSQYSEEDFKL